MCKVEFLGALEAEKLTKQKWEQYCGTPCILHFKSFPYTYYYYNIEMNTLYIPDNTYLILHIR